MIEKIMAGVIFLAALGLLVWAIHEYAELPTVEFSVSQQRVVAVKSSEGKALPFPPLPEKYEKIYVE